MKRRVLILAPLAIAALPASVSAQEILTPEQQEVIDWLNAAIDPHDEDVSYWPPEIVTEEQGIEEPESPSSEGDGNQSA